MSRWTESRADPVQSVQTKKHSIRSDHSDEEEAPGAYRISRNKRRDESFLDEWDPTEQLNTDPLSIPHEIESARECNVEFLNVDTLLNQHAIESVREHGNQIPNTGKPVKLSNSIFSADDSHALPSNTDSTGQTKELWYQSKRFILVIVLSIILIIISIILGIVLFTRKQESGAHNSPLWTENCKVDNQVKLAELELNPFLQCQLCFGKIQAIGNEVTDAYMQIERSKLFRDHVGNNTIITSCEPQNIALLWVAQNLRTENAGSDLSSEPTDRTLSRFVLALLYASLGGDNWFNTRNWLTSDSECNWFGIECDEEERVSSLVLSENNLTGSLDERFGLLSGLRTLDLGNNFITGTIPSAVWSLPLLEKLQLNNNFLAGTFMPNSMTDITSNLKQLSLKRNSDLKGPFPRIFNMTGLVDLDLSFTGLSGSIPSSLGLLTVLKGLILSNTAISGTIPMAFGKMTSLVDFFIDSTLVSGTIPYTVGNLENLVNFITYGNVLEGRIPSEIGRCSQLESIMVSQNRLTGVIPSEIANCHQLKMLDFSFNDFIDIIPPEFERLVNLAEIRVSCTFISSPLPVGLCNQSTVIEFSGEHQYDSLCSCCKDYGESEC